MEGEVKGGELEEDDVTLRGESDGVVNRKKLLKDLCAWEEKSRIELRDEEVLDLGFLVRNFWEKFHTLVRYLNYDMMKRICIMRMEMTVMMMKES